MRVVRKQMLSSSGDVFSLPVEHKIVDCKFIDHNQYIWIEEDPSHNLAEYEFINYFEDDLIPDGSEHVGTSQNEYGFDFHLYRKKITITAG